jgi:hypothetical protein
MWIPSHSGITENENTLEVDINDKELYPPQDLIIWMKKTDEKTDKKGEHREKTP